MRPKEAIVCLFVSSRLGMKIEQIVQGINAYGLYSYRDNALAADRQV